ncbi:PREDICTED: uncharacterized protein LOC105564553 [Vollenhovia emeryi]|uniref:uncharacterized protein LOC105564553 n=1 Tax=Vollenhovia emeryi TaxID=411798 RepID=UPI0005F4BAC4|nr:PREDICTED: uncharacterized protein LOC105564553 [Vollenhovia emeryi]
MDDGVQNGLQPDQWLSTVDKGEKRASSLGSGAFRFIRTRSSIRRELKRQCHRSKTGDSYGVQDNHAGSGGGGGIGKWLRVHLGGGSKGSHDVNSTFSTKGNANTGDNGRDNKSLAKTIYTSQNLYCSLPREHGRYMHNGPRKIINHGNSAKSHGYDRPRSNSMNHHEKSMSSDLGTLTRGGPIYGSEGRSLKKRNRDRRRHSLHETQDQGRNRRRSLKKIDCTVSTDVDSICIEPLKLDELDGLNSGSFLPHSVNFTHPHSI